jgi:pilus assembly protein TadC
MPRPGQVHVVMRVLLGVVFGLIGIVLLARGDWILGVLFVAVAALRVEMALTLRRRREELQRRFPRRWD